MYKYEFQKKLNILPKSVLFYGIDNYTILSYVHRYIRQTNSYNSLLKQYFNEYNFSIATEYLSRNSLFGGINLLIINTEIKIKKSELDSLIQLSYKNPNSYFLYIYKGLDKNAKKITSSFLEKYNSYWVRLFQPKVDESIRILFSKSKSLNMKIDNSSIFLILERVKDLSIASSELNKLSILDRKISKEDIIQLIYPIEDLKLEEFSIKLFKKENIFKLLDSFLESNEDELSIFKSISLFLNYIFLYKSYSISHKRIDSQEILGYKLPIDIEKSRIEIVNRLSLYSLKKVSEYLLKNSIKIYSSSKNHKNNLFYLSLIKIQKLI